MADDVGSLLLRAGYVAAEQLEAAREAAKASGGTVPEALVRCGFVDDEELTAFYRSRLLIPRVNPSELAKLSNALLGRLPADMASEFRSIPIAMDADGNLTLVMSDPSDTKAVDEISFFTGSYVMRAIATQSQIAWCLAHYYKQKTGLYLDLVADGQWPESTVAERPAEPTPAYDDPSEKDTAPLSTYPDTGPIRKKTKKRKKGRQQTSKEGRKQEDGVEINLEAETGPLKTARKRPANQQPSPPELFARAGEIHSVAKPDRDLDESPAVVVSLDPEESAVVLDYQRGTDTAPILLSEVKQRLAEQEAREQAAANLQAAAQSVIDDEQSGPIILDQSRRKRRTTRRTKIGIGEMKAQRADAGLAERRAEDTDSKDTIETRAWPKSTAGARAVATTPRSHDMVGDAEWGEPGTTIPPSFLGAPSSSYEGLADAIPVAVDEDVTSEITVNNGAPTAVAPEADETNRTEAPPMVRHSRMAEASARLLMALRAIDHAESKKAVVNALLDFLDSAFERTGFLALRQDDLVAWMVHGCADDVDAGVSIALDQPSTFRSAVRMRLPYNGPIEDDATKKLARDLDIPDALDLLVLPLSVRERVVGVLFGMGSHGKIFEEHVAVLSQAAAEAFEQILLNRRS